MHMAEDGMRCAVEMELYNEIIKKAPQYYGQNFDPNEEEVSCYNDLAALTSPMKLEYDMYKAKLDLWTDEAKTILRLASSMDSGQPDIAPDELTRRVNDAHDELTRRVDFVPWDCFLGGIKAI